MEFKQEDRDMLIRHDQKLQTICDSVKELKEDNKEDNKEIKKEMKAGFDKIFDKLDENTIGCSTNRIDCTKDMDKKIAKKVDWKYFGGAITLLITVFGFFLKYGT